MFTSQPKLDFQLTFKIIAVQWLRGRPHNMSAPGRYSFYANETKQRFHCLLAKGDSFNAAVKV